MWNPRRHDVADDDENALGPVEDPAGRIRQNRVREQREVQVAEEEPHGEDPLGLAVLERTDEQREPDPDHERAHAVRGPERPRDEPRSDVGPRDGDARGGIAAAKATLSTRRS